MLRLLAYISLTLSLALFFGGCTTIPTPPQPSPPVAQTETSPDKNPSLETTATDNTIIVAQPLPKPPVIIEIFAPPAPPPEPPVIEIFEQPKWYNTLAHWQVADVQPALTSFIRSCASFTKADPLAALNPNLPEYGRYDDWQPACDEALFVGAGAYAARRFFEEQFEPTSISTPEGESGLLTGYYEPEISVRKIPDSVYSEPILAKPDNEATRTLPRAQINARSSRIIAYGKPIEVFFMQVQGSGRMKYADGTSIRAAYAGNNGFNGGDYRGRETGVLVSVQDTGNAIRGPLRGDLFFGSGDEAGDKAGVMKHPVKWTILVPKALAARLRKIS